MGISDSEQPITGNNQTKMPTSKRFTVEAKKRFTAEANSSLQGILERISSLIDSDPTRKGHVDNPDEFRDYLTRFLRQFVETIDCELGSIYMVDHRDKNLIGIATFGYDEDITDIVYKLGAKHMDGKDLYGTNDRKGEGITAFVATTGKELWFDRKTLPSSHPAHAGRIDERQWTAGRKFRNCGIIPLTNGKEIVGVVKLENIASDDLNDYTISEERKKLILAISPYIALAIGKHRRRLIQGDKQYRITITKKKHFEKIDSGHVVLEHILTSICKSDYDYFIHSKSKEKLSERLPLVLGHETVAKIRELSYEQSYRDTNEDIRVGDRVVVIPQIHCGKCPTCKASNGTVKTFGENYCENVKHMASNSEGSLRTVYSYWSDLLIKIPHELEDELVVLAEPISQIVQVWRELGFSDSEKNKGFKLKIPAGKKFKELILYNAFKIDADKFDDYFKVFANDTQTPRTVLRLMPNNKMNNGSSLFREFSHYTLMRRGLFLTALDKNCHVIKKQKPKVLILGTGSFAYIAAVLLRFSYGLEEEQVFVYGRRRAPLKHFERIANIINISIPKINNKVIGFDDDENPNVAQKLKLCQKAITEKFKGDSINFDIILECAGGESTDNLVDFALDNISDNGIIALFGLWDNPIRVDFRKVMKNQVTFKGFFRACRQSYKDAIRYLQIPKFATEIRELIKNHCPPIQVDTEEDLDKAFEESNSKNESSWGKVLVKLSH